MRSKRSGARLCERRAGRRAGRSCPCRPTGTPSRGRRPRSCEKSAIAWPTWRRSRLLQLVRLELRAAPGVRGSPRRCSAGSGTPAAARRPAGLSSRSSRCQDHRVRARVALQRNPLCVQASSTPAVAGHRPRARGREAVQTILIANPKGGSGKTTLATNVAGWLAGKRQRVVLADVDPQRSATAMAGAAAAAVSGDRRRGRRASGRRT